jgi:hypothetical protein
MDSHNNVIFLSQNELANDCDNFSIWWNNVDLNNIVF